MVLLQNEGILPKGPYPPCLRMADRVLLAGYPRKYVIQNHATCRVCFARCMSLNHRYVLDFRKLQTLKSYSHLISQRETTVHCNIVFHWLGAYTKWPLWFRIFVLFYAALVWSCFVVVGFRFFLPTSFTITLTMAVKTEEYDHKSWRYNHNKTRQNRVHILWCFW